MGRIIILALVFVTIFFAVEGFLDFLSKKVFKDEDGENSINSFEKDLDKLADKIKNRKQI